MSKLFYYDTKELDWKILNNSIHTWFYSLCTFVICLLVFYFLKNIFLKKFSKFADASENKLDDIFLVALRKTKWWFLVVFSFYFSTIHLEFNLKIEKSLTHFIFIASLAQLGIMLSEVITYVVQHAKKTSENGERTTTMTALGLIGKIVLWSTVLLFMLDNIGINIKTLMAGLGVGGIAVALAMQNILGDLIASLSIVLDKPFVIGDFIYIDPFSGTVEHIGLKTTRIRSISGEQLIISNADLLKSKIRNYKRMEERRILFTLNLVYQTEVDKLQLIPQLIRDLIVEQKHTRFERANLLRLGLSNLEYEVVYYVENPDYNLYITIQEAINLAILAKFRDENIEFAFPTQMLYVEQTKK